MFALVSAACLTTLTPVPVVFAQDMEPTVEGKTVHEWVARLKDKDAEVRREAVVALEKIGPGPRDVVPALIGALKDREAFVRQRVVLALWEFGSGARAAVPALAQA